VVDLGCGTGSLTAELTCRGYEMTGVDLSEDMLAVAADKCAELEPQAMFLHQDMSKLTLWSQVDAVVCCLDSLNYVTKPAAVQRTFQRVFRNLRPGGLFIFDIRTPYFLRSMDGQVCLDETEELCCIWRGEFSPRRNILSYYMDLFSLDADGKWLRDGELHEEYAYEPEDLALWLKEAGFTRIRQYGERKLRPPRPDEERIFFIACKGEN
jgi:ubiquinone/menaquinone biosynthesis C-methylase UbiE